MNLSRELKVDLGHVSEDYYLWTKSQQLPICFLKRIYWGEIHMSQNEPF